MMNVTVVRSSEEWQRLWPRGYCRGGSGAVGVGRPTVPIDVPRRAVQLGDATERLSELPTASIDCCVTSPPYYGLRDYRVIGQIGLEASVDGWVEDLRRVLAEVGRVLKPAGSLWLNLGDSFSRHLKYGAPAKSLLAAPERLLLALMADGWLVRGKVIWDKPNSLPNSVLDRPNLTYEVIYFLVRSPHYFFDLDVIRPPHRSRVGRRTARHGTAEVPSWAGPLAAGSQSGLRRTRATGLPGHRLGKNPGSVWTIPTKGFRGPHFATFPPELVQRPILATCPEAVCSRCGMPWRRAEPLTASADGQSAAAARPATGGRPKQSDDDRGQQQQVGQLIGCACGAPTVPGIVLDPFMGSGTVGVVAEQLGRDWLGIELSAQFRELALQRIRQARHGP